MAKTDNLFLTKENLRLEHFVLVTCADKSVVAARSCLPKKDEVKQNEAELKTLLTMLKSPKYIYIFYTGILFSCWPSIHLESNRFTAKDFGGHQFSKEIQLELGGSWRILGRLHFDSSASRLLKNRPAGPSRWPVGKDMNRGVVKVSKESREELLPYKSIQLSIFNTIFC